MNVGGLMGTGQRSLRIPKMKGPIRLIGRAVTYNTQSAWEFSQSFQQISSTNSRNGMILSTQSMSGPIGPLTSGGNVNLWQYLDFQGAAILNIPANGGPIDYGDHIGAAGGVFSPATQIDATQGSVIPPLKIGSQRLWFIPSASTPATYLAGTTGVQAGDIALRAINSAGSVHLYYCTTGGGSSAWTGVA